MAFTLLSFGVLHNTTDRTHMKQFPMIFKLSCAAALTSLAITVAAQNIVVDPGFEASTDSPNGNAFVLPWVATDSSGTVLSDVGGNPSFAHSGTNYANLGTKFPTTASPSTSTGTLSQTLTTVAGGRYNLSFWLANNVALPTNSFQVQFGTTLVFATPLMAPPFPSDGAYRLFGFSDLLATGTSTLLQFQFQHDQDFWRLDDISVLLPEGGAPLWLAIPLLGGLCLLHARFNRNRATSGS
jgi:hypothetical protein